VKPIYTISPLALTPKLYQVLEKQDAFDLLS